MQLAQEIEPSEDDDFPVVQSMHELEPVVEAYLPSAHDVQEVAVPVTAVYLPFSQLVHDAAASMEYVPSAQPMHWDLSAEAYFPPTHFVHVEDPDSDMYPTEQLEHVLWSVDGIVPAPHGKQED